MTTGAKKCLTRFALHVAADKVVVVDEDGKTRVIGLATVVEEGVEGALAAEIDQENDRKQNERLTK